MKLITNSSSDNKISYPFFVGFIYLLNNMELVKKIYLTCAEKSEDKEVTKSQFLKEALQFSQITPCEIHILFSLIKGFRTDE